MEISDSSRAQKEKSRSLIVTLLLLLTYVLGHENNLYGKLHPYIVYFYFQLLHFFVPYYGIRFLSVYPRCKKVFVQYALAAFFVVFWESIEYAHDVAKIPWLVDVADLAGVGLGFRGWHDSLFDAGLAFLAVRAQRKYLFEKLVVNTKTKLLFFYVNWLTYRAFVVVKRNDARKAGRKILRAYSVIKKYSLPYPENFAHTHKSVLKLMSKK